MSSHTRKNYAAWAKNCYSADFNEFLSPHTKALTGHRCVLCGGKAEITHHAYYTQFGAKDEPGKNLFPLCEKHHNEAHIRSKNWVVTNQDDPIKGRFNTTAYRALLTRGWEKYYVGGSQRGKTFRPGNVRNTEVGLNSQDVLTAIAVLAVVVFICCLFLQ